MQTQDQLQQLLEQVHAQWVTDHSGEVADYIPELATAAGSKWGLAGRLRRAGAPTPRDSTLSLRRRPTPRCAHASEWRPGKPGTKARRGYATAAPPMTPPLVLLIPTEVPVMVPLFERDPIVPPVLRRAVLPEILPLLLSALIVPYC